MKAIKDMTEPELADLLNCVGGSIETTCRVLRVERPMFAVILFNDPQIAQYVCNCERADVIKALRETADRLEKRETLERVPFSGRS